MRASDAMRPLAADKLLSDPRLQAAKQLLLAAIKAAQAEITEPKPPDPDRAASYSDLLTAIAKARGAPLWHTYLGSGIGCGPLVELLDGSVKYDLISGIGTHYLGHSHPALTAAAFDAAASDLLMQGHLQQNKDSADLMRLWLDQTGMDHCFLCSSGAMANENALKIAFQKRAPAQRVLAFTHCFMGRTLALAQITDKPQYRQGLPSTLFVDYLPFYEANDPIGSCQRALDTLDSYLERYPGQYAALCCEMVLGEGGFYPGSHDFFVPLLTRARQANIAIIADEVQTCGRLPKLFAFQYFDLAAYVDIVTVGKLTQVCATLFRSPWNPRPGLLSQTFTASTAAIRGSLALLQELLTGRYFGDDGHIAALHTAFVQAFTAIAKRHPGLISGPYGIGAMLAFTPYDGSAENTIRLVKALFVAGIIVFTAGTQPTRVRLLLPAGALTCQDIPAIIAILERVLIEQQPTASTP